MKRTASTPLFLLLLALPLAALLGSLGIGQPRTAQAAVVSELTLGFSGQGRPITAVRVGTGPRKLVVVGDTHGGPEANTYALTRQLIEHFSANPEQVPASVRLYLIPTLNPDGLELGSRFNANGVDLNRNMNTNLDACPENDWRVQVQGAYGIVSDTGGAYAESEVESRLIRSFLLDASGAIFLHSNAGLVFPAFCEHPPSITLGTVYAQAAGYLYNRYWPRYMITGGMHDWAGSLGIAAITPELVTAEQSEFEWNLAGLQAVLAQAEELLLLPADQSEGGVIMPALIWRYWKSHGGADAFGLPLAPAHADAAGPSQRFSRATLLVQPDQADTPALVQPAPIGRGLYDGPAAALAPVADPGDPSGAVRFFAATGHTLRGAFGDYWQRASGELVLGAPISEEFAGRAADGSIRTLQYFERGALAYYPELAEAPVQPEPLGWQALQRAGVLAAAQIHQVR